ncbi:hypothetical protein ABIA49_003325 [Bacillus safensis]
MTVFFLAYIKKGRKKKKEGGGGSLSGALSFVVFALASFRLTRLIVFDTITAPFRRLFHEEQEEVNEQGEVETYIIIKGEGLRSWVGELLSCYWCTGIWCTAALLLIYILFPVISMWLNLLLAIAAAAGIIEAIVSKLVK